MAILLAIGHEPALLILDEPTSALDPIARAQFLELLLKIIQQEGKTILIASHILTDIEKIIAHVVSKYCRLRRWNRPRPVGRRSPRPLSWADRMSAQWGSLM